LWKRHTRFSRDGTWNRIHVHLLAEADAAEVIDWQLSSDSTISRVHQHGASLSRRPSWTSRRTRGELSNYNRS